MWSLERLVEVELKGLDKEDGTGRVAADLKRAEERRRKIDRTVKQLIDAQAEADSKLLVKALKDKLAELDREADELDRHIAGLRLRIESLSERRRAAEATLGVLDRIRARIQDGTATPRKNVKSSRCLRHGSTYGETGTIAA
jgi:hypothetical protein